MLLVETRVNSASNARWALPQQGYFFISIPDSAMWEVDRKLAITASVEKFLPPEKAFINPNGPSIASTPAVNPKFTNLAAVTPQRAALPAWNGLVIVPKF